MLFQKDEGLSVISAESTMNVFHTDLLDYIDQLNGFVPPRITAHMNLVFFWMLFLDTFVHK